MRRLTWIWRGLLDTFRRHRADADMNDELAAHIAHRADDLVRTGLPAGEAHRQARLEFGGMDRYREETRETRRPLALEHAVRDIGYACRGLARHPLFVCTAALSIGLGTGVNAVLFSAVSAALFHTPSVVHADRMVWVEPGNSDQFSHENFRDLRESGIFEAAVGYRRAALSVRVDTAAERVDGIAVTAAFFDDLGVTAHMGRTFGASEAQAERQPRLAVISHDSWQRRFNADPHVVGRSVAVNGHAFDIVGVLPAGFRPLTRLEAPEIYVPISSVVLPNLDRRQNGNGLTVLARLRPHTTQAQAASATTALGAELERRFPEENEGTSRPARVRALDAMPDAPAEVAVLGIALVMLFGLVLLIACANVTGLTLARIAARHRELALRTALGAQRTRIAQMLLAESLVVAFIGTAVGVGLAVAAMPLLRHVTIADVGTLHLAVQPDLKLMAFAVLLVALSGLLVGVVPAIRAAQHVRASTDLQEGGRSISQRLRLRSLFVVGQVAGAVVLLALSLMLLRSVTRLQQMEVGFDVDRAVVVNVHQDAAAFAADGGLQQARGLAEALGAGNGLGPAAPAAIVPLGGETSATRVVATRRPDEYVRTIINSVGAGYFESLGIPLRRGRAFDTRDHEGGARVAIVNERLSHLLFPGEEALGQSVSAFDEAPLEIVGVVADSKVGWLGETPQPLLYYAFDQRPRLSSQMRDVRVLVRTAADPAMALKAIESIARAQTGPDAVVVVRTLREAASMEVKLRRAGSRLLAGIGALGLLLASMGLYGVMSYLVASRTTEIGVRLALGAPRGLLLMSMLRRGVVLVALGLALGLPLAMLAARGLAGTIAGISAVDPIALAAVIAVLLVVGAAASFVPARRATKIDPSVALRHV